MNLFKDLNKILDNCDITLTLKKKGENISVMVLPKNAKVKMDLKPLVVTGTADDLDGSFMGLIMNPLLSTTYAFNNIKEYEENLNKKRNEKTGKKSATPAKPTAATPEPDDEDDKDDGDEEDNTDISAEVPAPKDSPKNAAKPATPKPPAKPIEKKPEPVKPGASVDMFAEAVQEPEVISSAPLKSPITTNTIPAPTITVNREGTVINTANLRPADPTPEPAANPIKIEVEDW